MTPRAYLTIDDSPTKHTDELTDFLAERNIPAILFCVGGDYADLGVPSEGMESMPDPVFRAIQKGFLIGNHTYSHSRYSDMRYEDMVKEIEKTESIIEGKEHSFNLRDISKDAGRGIRLALRNCLWQAIYLIGLILLTLIPIVGWITPVIALFMECYFYGFSMLDYSFSLR